MAIPGFQELMLPLLKLANIQKNLSLKEAVSLLSNEFKLNDKEKEELLASGQTIIYNRVAWAKTYLNKAGLIDSPQKGIIIITDEGKRVIKSNPKQIDIRYLEKFPVFLKFRDKKNNKNNKSVVKENINKTPEEIFEEAYQELKNDLIDDLIKNIRNTVKDPSFFEKLVVDVLIKMGYGGSRKEAGKAVGKSSDGGVDGVINEDKLGLDTIYIQAKNWENVVGRPEVQKFAGALQGKRAKKGVFITTSDFTKEAQDFVKNIDSKIILINGQELAELMIENNVGVSITSVYELKRIDSDFFEI